MRTGQFWQRPVIEVLYVQDCPNYPDTLALVQRVLADLGIDAEVRTTLIIDQATAEQARFAGSPTVRVDGRDVEPGGEPPSEISVACRLYRLEHRLAGQPTEAWVREALLRAVGRADRQRDGCPSLGAGMTTLGPASDSLRRRPPAPALGWVCEVVGAGSRIVSVRPLPSSWLANHAVTVADRHDRHHQLVLRRWARPGWDLDDPDYTAQREATILELPAPSAVPAPEVMAADPGGTACDVPAFAVDPRPRPSPSADTGRPARVPDPTG
jgi:hypothetical protein